MKLTNKDKELLTSWGHPESDFAQIEKAMSKTTYETNGKKISRDEALETLGRKEYLSGISRSAFHWSACRGEEGNYVYFDSSKLFK